MMPTTIVILKILGNLLDFTTRTTDIKRIIVDSADMDFRGGTELTIDHSVEEQKNTRKIVLRLQLNVRRIRRIRW